jgi:hypothetical protein
MSLPSKFAYWGQNEFETGILRVYEYDGIQIKPYMAKLHIQIFFMRGLLEYNGVAEYGIWNNVSFCITPYLIKPLCEEETFPVVLMNTVLPISTSIYTIDILNRVRYIDVILNLWKPLKNPITPRERIAIAIARDFVRYGEKCPITQETLHGTIAITECYCVFQADALERWANRSDTCPSCRKKLSYRTVDT